ncbi:MAG: hypothetical protein J7517_08985 [Sphingobium yanoikuyae]|nr:hypothetical protein [Sphingobium yanoikuyae]
MMRTIMAMMAAGLAAVSVQAAGPGFDPRALKAVAGPPNEVMVLGTPHLSGWSKDFDAQALVPLIDRLAAWKPQAIAVETLSGLQCDALRRAPFRYAETVETYCWDATPARQATGLDVPAATAEVERRLTAWPERPTASDRRHLAALFLAAADQGSALVQWLRLDGADRHVGDGLDAILVARLETLRQRRNEEFLIAAPLAARLGLERLEPMDDHSADRPYRNAEEEKAAGAAIMKAWDNEATARRKAADAALQPGIRTGAGVLALYRAYNAPDQAQAIYDSDFGAALKEPSPERFGRGYAGYWEVRNLRMAANIRDVFAAAPGQRMLVIVGASHKFYLQAYLDMMHDVRLVDTDAILH